MKQRNIVTCIILSLVTCGIYGLYWLYCVIGELDKEAGVTDKPALTVIILSIITCNIYGALWMYKAGDKLNKVKEKAGTPVDGNSGLVLLILYFVFSPAALALIQTELNKVAAK